MNNFETDLKKAGLAGNESKVYLELLRRGSISANDLSKKLGMDRTLAYTVLNHLIDKGLVNYKIKHNKKYFEAADPDNLRNPIKKREAFVTDLIPKLRRIEKIKDVKQEINIYEGKEGLRTFIRELSKAKYFCSFGSTGKLYDALYEMPHVAKEFIKKGVKGKIIISKKYIGHSITKLKNLEFRYLDVESEATTCIFRDKVSIHVVTEKPIIIIINSKTIADSYRNHFDILWNCAMKK